MPGHATRSGAPIGSSTDYFTITPSNTVDMERPSHGGIRVAGGPGTVALVRDDDTVVSVTVAETDYLPVVAKRVNVTGTTGGLELTAL